MTNAVNVAALGSTGVSPGFKNRIINGDMRIDQRNAGVGVSLSNNTVFSVDRFQVSDSGSGVFTAQQSSDAPAGFLKSVVLTVTTADSSLTGADYYQIQQRIEGYNLADLNIGTANAKTTTLSFWVKGSITGSYSLAILREGATGGCRSYVTTYTINTANTWEYKTITIPMDTSVAQNTTEQTNGNALYVGWQFGTGPTYQTATLNQWQTGVYVAGTSTTQWISTLGATVYITGVQLEVGTTATNFDFRSYGTELALCQRYCFASDSSAIVSGIADSSTTVWVHIKQAVTMRAVPTYSVTSGNVSISDDYVSDFAATSPSLTGGNNGVDASRIRVAGFTGLTSARFYGGIPGTSKLIASAEL